ncbi:MAG: hypothetical protein Q4615_07600 [Paracoccus aminovorans]|nr:hypothetical protein [Paracoccus aminovorans]
MISALVSVGGLLLSVIAYLLGRQISEPEKILSEKRRIYEEFLRRCPEPNEAYLDLDEEKAATRLREFAKLHPIVSLYASTNVSIAISRYYQLFDAADRELRPDSPPLHEAFRSAAKAHNDIILEMRRDAFSWSAFGHRGKSRLPSDAIEQAGRSSF